MNKEMKKFIEDRFSLKFPKSSKTKFKEAFKKALKEFKELETFNPNENVFEDSNGISEEAHYIMRLSTQYYLTKALEAMKVNLEDDNVAEVLEEGNIGTAGRIAKVWCGSGIHDDTELGGGRWAKPVRIASFPNTGTKSIPITKRVDIISNCSHHFIPFSTIAREDSYAVISYIPNEVVLGISKLQRVANHISQRFWLQEDLTKKLYEAVSKVAETESVYVRIVNAVHGCEMFRGSKSNDGCFTSEYYGGAYEDPEIRKLI